MKIDKNSPWFLVMIALTGICVYSVVLLVQPADITERLLTGKNDFIQLYAGARLMGSPDLYSRAAVEQVQREAAGIESKYIYFLRLPFYACFLRPLAYLPYTTAYWLFQGISLSCFFWFLWKFVPGCRELAAFASISIPFFATIQNAQDTALVLFFLALSIVLVRRNLDFWAGFVLSLCAIKIHLVLLIPLVLVLHRRWRIVYGGVAGGALLATISFAVAGLDWPRRYLAAFEGQNPSPEYMPNLHSLWILLGRADLPVEIVLHAAVVLLVGYLALKLPDYELVFAFALIGSLLVSLHSYTQDCLLLLLSLAIILKRSASKRVRELTELSASPIPYFFLLAGAPFNVFLPALLTTILAMAARTPTKKDKPL
jgi:hypothetical protein